ncbi:hypothetical protein Pfo_019012 [Paulownia fortunei]|nr:hypothetical protein Pfo_019012 [Paulownia fortunei]
MEPDHSHSTPKSSSLRWQIRRRALLRQNSCEEISLGKISRRTTNGFNLIPWHVVNEGGENSGSLPKRDACFCYTLILPNAPKLFLHQRWEDCVDLNDFEVCNRYDIDNIGLVCPWPSEDLLTYYSMSHLGSFRSKRVIELGSGYGLAGLVIAMVTDASQVVISDGNPQVVKSMILHWDQHEVSDISGTFDVIVASHCTFFKEFHKGLTRTIKCLQKENGPSEGILFSPKSSDSLDKFLLEAKDSGLHFTRPMIQKFGGGIKYFINGDHSWPNYESDTVTLYCSALHFVVCFCHFLSVAELCC